MPANVDAILALEVPLIVQIGERSTTLGEILNLAPGSILELSKTADRDLDLLINNKPIGQGRAMKVGENFGVRVTDIGRVTERVDAIAAGAASPAPVEEARDSVDEHDDTQATSDSPSTIERDVAA